MSFHGLEELVALDKLVKVEFTLLLGLLQLLLVHALLMNQNLLLAALAFRLIVAAGDHVV